MSLTLHTQALVLADRADLALQAGCPRDAHEHLSRALHLHPDLPDGRLLEARVQLALHQPDQALAALDAHVQQHTDEQHRPEVTFLRTQALAAAGMDEYALFEAAQLTCDFPDDPRGQRIMAQVFLRLEQKAQALAPLRQSQHLEPSHSALARLQVELLAQTDPQAAAEQALQLAQGSARQPMQLSAARLRRQGGRLREALELYEQLVCRCGDDPALLTEAALLAEQLGDLARATTWLGRAVALDKEDRTQAQAALARVHLRCGRFPEAVDCWTHILHRQGHNIPALAGLVVVAILARRRQPLRRIIKRLHTHASAHERRHWLATWWLHGAVGMEIRRQRETARVASDAVAVASAGSRAPAAVPVPPAEADSASSLLHGLLERTTEALVTHVQNHPERADTHYHLAVARAALGHPAAAQASVNKALRINPHYAAADRLSHRLAGHPDRRQSRRAA